MSGGNLSGNYPPGGIYDPGVGKSKLRGARLTLNLFGGSPHASD